MRGQFFTTTRPWHQHPAQNKSLTGVQSGIQANPWRSTPEGLMEPRPSVKGRDQGLGSRPCSALALVTLTLGRRWPWARGDEVGETGWDEGLCRVWRDAEP